MSRIKFINTAFLFLVCFLLFSKKACATNDPEIVRIFSSAPSPSGVTYSPLTVGANDELVDDIYYNNLSTILNPDNDKITNVISILIREADIAKIKSDFTATVNIQIDYTLVNGSTGTISNTALTLNYTIGAGLKYNARQTLKFDQCRKVKITILSISANNYNWNIWEVINLENRMLRKRDYVFNYSGASLVPSHDPVTVANADELSVNWSGIPSDASGKTHIDVEWTWVDAEAYTNYQISGQFDADLLFKNNSTRITVERSITSYKIPLIYDGAGRLFYRIRPVQLRENEQVVNGQWSANSVNGITYFERGLTQGHQENLNWQTTTSFAEEGKRKTVVQYFDGTLRGRQTVTKDNVSNLTVVAESFYDFQGKPTVNILPAPTMNSVLKYTADFNKFVGGFVTPKEAFDLMPTNSDACNYQTPKLDKNNPVGGAAQYYSDQNPEKLLGFNKFIPDADGYAYTETRYTPDATGRIEAQGGVGATFQLGKGNGINDHDTKYFYGKPDQKELDALFGTEAGDATHYSKNMVRDANGQYSVSYVDMHGRTIATALAGKSPANLKPLQSYAAAPLDFKKDLVTASNNRAEGRTVVASTTLLVTQEVPHKFHYELNPLSAEIIACNPAGQTVCYDCYYNLEIRITGACGENIVKTANNLSFNNGTAVYDVSCGTLPAPIIFEFTELLKEGEYNITKTLTVNKNAQDWYRDNIYNVKNNCKTFTDFYNLIYDEMMQESSECDICKDCDIYYKDNKNIKKKSTSLSSVFPHIPNITHRKNNDVSTLRATLINKEGSNNESNVSTPPPSNNECTGAINLTVNSDYNCAISTAGSTTGGTAGYPALSCFAASNDFGDVWYKFIATTTNHRVALSSISYYGHPTNIVAVYSGTCSALMEISCNQIIFYSNSFVKDLTGLTVGATYYVRVGGAYGGMSYNICIGTPPPLICPPTIPSTCTSVCAQPKNILDAIRDLMMDDMTPDYGQYARMNIDLNGNDIIEHIYFPGNDRYEFSEDRDYNIFNPGNAMGLKYRRPLDATGAPVPDYLDENGLIDPDGKSAKLLTMTPEQFTENFKLAWAAQLLPYHPEYCKLITAENNLGDSYKRDAIIEETDTWNEAYDKGFIENLTTPGEGTGILDKDQFFICGNRENYRNEMTHYINENFNLYQSSPTLSFWKIAWLSVFCKEYNYNYNCALNAPMKPAYFYNFSSACDADKNAVWRIYRTLFLSEKDRMVNEWLNAQCPTIDYSLIDGAGGGAGPNHYERRFGKPADYYTNSNHLADLIASAISNPNDALSQQYAHDEYKQTCESYKTVWITKLRECSMITSLDQAGAGIDPATGFPVNDFITGILTDLVNVCYNGSDEQHPMGSSTVMPGITGIPQSFREAFDNQWNNYFGPPTTQTIECNQDLLDFPQPYDHQSPIASESIDEPKDECVCGRLAELATEKANDNVYNLLYPSGTLSEYILYKHGTEVEQTLIDLLLEGCNVKNTCNTYLSPIEIPAILSCNNPIKNCVECEEFHALVEEFQNKYSPLSNGVIYQDPANDDEIAANKALAKFINNKTGLTKSWAEYLDFKLQCELLLNPHPVICQDVMFPDAEEKDTCNQFIATLAFNAAFEQYKIYLQANKDFFENTYLNKCLEAKDKEIFTVQALYAPKDPPAEYHYTLYYYDQAGNLVKTIPPEGVRPNFSPSHFTAVKNYRSNESMYPAVPMPHFLPTQYRYNTLNQVVQQKSPDGGLSKFWYDALGRLVISQNGKQRGLTSSNLGLYSYTKYDALGRITEVGEKKKTAGSPEMTQLISQGSSLNAWLAPTASEPLSQITKTIYDNIYSPLCTNNLLCQQNMRNRVSYSYVQALEDGSAGANTGNPINDAPWESATFYTYDIHGNVDVLLQDYKKSMGLIYGNRFKKVSYKYDLISGKVNEVGYQPGQADAFYHRYNYDLENKITEVYTSKEYVYWEADAKYDYFRHGPLARTTLGHLEVQGVDYAYTLQGWLKGVNTTSLKRSTVIGNGEDCGDNSAVDNLYVYNRPVYTPYYKAKTSINFMPSAFESLLPDNFEASIDPSLASCTTDGNAGDEVYDYTNDGKYDMGQDGQTNASGLFVPNNNSGAYSNGTPYNYGSNTTIPDAYGFSLNYFNGDYNRINTAANNPFAAINMRIPTNDAANPYSAEQLFNGNIGAMAVSIPKLGKANVYGYNYDQLNRITNMNVFNGLSNTNTFVPYAIQDYKEAVTYDANGNIKTYLRNGHNNPSQFGPPHIGMDNLTYQYEKDAAGNMISNKLRYVHDQVAATNYNEDIDSQTPLTLAQMQDPINYPIAATDNYAYDPIGNLIKDEKENIQSIEWTVYGKISKITKLKDGSYTYITYTYDASGNRITKSVKKDSYAALTTFYVRDAGGNVLSVYDDSNPSQFAATPGPLTQKEIHLYGSSRLAVYNVNVNVQAVGQSRIYVTMPGVTGNEAELFTFARGNKLFELSNHLGNVLVTVSDKRLAVNKYCDPTIDRTCQPLPDGSYAILSTYYKADVITANDYYPFGMTMPGRKYNAPGATNHRYGFNGMEKASEITSDDYDFGARIYDGRLGRWLSTDMLEKKYPSISPYVFVINSPIRIIDIDGNDIIILSAPKGAGGFGHAAILVGNDKTGWKLYSKNGTFGSSGVISSGPTNNNPENGVSFRNLKDFANSPSNFHKGEVQYTSAFRIASSEDVDKKMKTAASKQVNIWYDVTGTVTGSCIDVCSDALEAGGFKSGKKGKIDGGSYPGRAQILVGKLKPMVPNERYKNIVEQNKGVDVTNQILPTEQSKEKYKKEEEDSKKPNPKFIDSPIPQRRSEVGTPTQG